MTLASGTHEERSPRWCKGYHYLSIKTCSQQRCRAGHYRKLPSVGIGRRLVAQIDACRCSARGPKRAPAPNVTHGCRQAIQCCTGLNPTSSSTRPSCAAHTPATSCSPEEDNQNMQRRAGLFGTCTQRATGLVKYHGGENDYQNNSSNNFNMQSHRQKLQGKFNSFRFGNGNLENSKLFEGLVIFEHNTQPHT